MSLNHLKKLLEMFGRLTVIILIFLNFFILIKTQGLLVCSFGFKVSIF